MSLKQNSSIPTPTDLMSRNENESSNASKKSISSNKKQEASAAEVSIAEVSAIEGSVVHTPPSKKLKNPVLFTKDAKNVEGLPENEALDQPTEVDSPNPDFPGENTEDLSDITEEGRPLPTRTTNAFTSWYSRIQPLIRNKRVRVYSALNLMLFVANFILFIAVIIYAVMTTNSGIEARRHLINDKPCLFQFSEWSECPNNCTVNGTTNYKTRKVIPESIVVARGKFALQSPCPDDLETLTEKAPCNTHACPVPLGSFEFTKEHWPIDVKNPSKGCYRIRNIPRSDISVIIDGKNLTEEIAC